MESPNTIHYCTHQLTLSYTVTLAFCNELVWHLPRQAGILSRTGYALITLSPLLWSTSPCHACITMYCPWPIYPMHTTGIQQRTVNAFALLFRHSVTHWVCISHCPTQLLWSTWLCHAVTLLHCQNALCLPQSLTVQASRMLVYFFKFSIVSYILDYFLRSKIILHSLCHSPGLIYHPRARLVWLG